MKKSKEIQQLENRLLRRGMVLTTKGNVITPPKRLYGTLGEEVLWILNQKKLSLSAKELAKYLCKDNKIIQKVMLKLTSSAVPIVTKEKKFSSFRYRSNFNKDLDIPSIYKMTRLGTTKKF